MKDFKSPKDEFEPRVVADKYLTAKDDQIHEKQIQF